MDRRIIHRSIAPAGEWDLVVYAPETQAPHFYAQFQHKKRQEAYAFGFAADLPAATLVVHWNLAPEVCGLFVAENCYALFYYGAKHRRQRRYRARERADKPFRQGAIAAFASEETVHYQNWEGLYSVPGLYLEKCSWCRQTSTSFYAVIFEGVRETVELQSEIVCETCSRLASAFIKMRKEGLSRKAILKDLGFRK